MTPLRHLLVAVVLPAVEAVLRDNELEELSIRRLEGKPREDVWLTLVAVGEEFRDLVLDGEAEPVTDLQLRERLRSNLVDFVAESGFGWGQNRDSGTA